MRDATHSAARRIVVAWRAPRAAQDTTLPHRVLPRVQAVAALMNQLCVRFPVVAAHNGTSSFAVACPETRHPDARAAAAAVQTPVHVYNMSTGAKMFALVLSRAAPGTGTGNGDINPLAPIAQVRRPPPPPPQQPPHGLALPPNATLPHEAFTGSASTARASASITCPRAHPPRNVEARLHAWTVIVRHTRH